ncbi:hypothetical protein D0X99_13635 [Algoriphagus lacus]|uniref:Uncharacterized protein n=1 Tax=Algoriphagus lacus TaxID=2056311 RepID=A0A418PQK6_9BACT|nr:hypothetical protein [Algoriphagus lacus]RIW14588.1 hypothetical protein D0X99_13635 [Algoriphagus lacus]
MNWDQLDQQLTEIVQKRNKLSQMDYSDESYDDLEEELHDLEDEFNDEYEVVFEPQLEKIYSKLKSDTDILLPTAYLANKYKEMLPDAKGIVTYEVSGKEGVPIESDQFDKMDVRIVLVPNPARFVLIVNGKPMKDLWRSR